MIYYHQYYLLSIIYYQLFITNKWACNILKLKPLFYLKAKREAILQKISKLQQKWEQNSSPISCEQNKIERHKSFKGEL